MNFLYAFSAPYSWAKNALRWLLGIGKQATKWPQWVHRLIRYLLIGLVVIVLCWVSPYVVPPVNVSGTGNALIKKWWLGLFFLAVYVFIQLVVHLVHILCLRRESEFPDIDEAWYKGLSGLAEQGLNIYEMPLYLVFGLTEGEEVSLHAGAGMKDLVPDLSSRGNSPLRFYGDENTVFVACHGVSAVSAQARGVSSGLMQNIEATQPPQNIDVNAEQTIRPGAAGGILRGVEATIAPGRVLSGSVPKAPVSQHAHVLDAKQLQLAERRVRYLCQLIDDERKPRCGINGMLMCVPYNWTADSRSKELAQPLHQDLAVCHRELHMLFPIITLLTGIDKLVGFTDFLRRGSKVDVRFSPNMRAGSRFPTGHAVDTTATQWVVESGLEWFRGWIYAAFAKDVDSRSNTRLYRLICEFDERQNQVAALLRHSFGAFKESPMIRLAGCYYVGFDGATSRGVFVKEVLRKLAGTQNEVTWSPERIARDRRLRTWASLAIGMAVVLGIADAYLIWRFWN